MIDLTWFSCPCMTGARAVVSDAYLVDTDAWALRLGIKCLKCGYTEWIAYYHLEPDADGSARVGEEYYRA